MGTVTLISGLPVEGVYVEARSESKDFYEEALTDGTGNFRLRGLLPDKTYTVKVATKEELRLGSSRIERSSPDHLSVKASFFSNNSSTCFLFKNKLMANCKSFIYVNDICQEVRALQPHSLERAFQLAKLLEDHLANIIKPTRPQQPPLLPYHPQPPLLAFNNLLQNHT